MVSVILPNYNHAPYLKLRIDSILNQTYSDFELIILDDCSPDNSRDIIEQYRNNPRVTHIVYNDKNSGSTFIQWQKGFKLAKGEYIWIAESDDYADTSFLEKVVSLLEQTNSSVGFSQSFYVNEHNEMVKEKEPVMALEIESYQTFVPLRQLYGCSIYNASMVVFRKDVVHNLDWELMTSFKLCGDWYFWNMIILNGQRSVCEVKEYLNYYRTHSTNTSKRKEAEGFSLLEGYTVSKLTAERLNLSDWKAFYIRWYNKWQIYKHEFSFSSDTNKNILFMFFKKQPIIAFLEIKRLFKRMLGLKAELYIDPHKK